MNNVFTNSVLKGIASALPKEKLRIEDLKKLYGDKQVERIRKVTGIDEIRVAPLEKTTSDYCVNAAELLFKQGIISPSSIDGVVFVSQTPDYLVPHTSALIQDRLGIPTNCIAMDLNFGCPGYVYGLFQAMSLIETGYCNNILLCAGDTISRYIHPLDRALRMVMGDGGTASVISATVNKSLSAFSFYTDGSGASLLQIPAGSNRIPHQIGKTDVEEKDEDGNIRTLENLFMDGSEIMNFALEKVPKLVEDVLVKIGWGKKDVDLFALHQANEFMVKFIAKRLRVELERVPINVKETGNTGSASIPVLLSNSYPGINISFNKTVLCGFGTGLACAAGAMDLSKTVILPSIAV